MSIDMLTSLIPDKQRELWLDYITFIKMGNKKFAYVKGSENTNIEKLKRLEKAMRRDFPISGNLLAKLQRGFIKENLSVSLLTDWLAVWRYISTLPQPYNEKRISEVIGNAASPLARMIMALNDENLSIYLPLCSLVSLVLLTDLLENKSGFTITAKWSTRQKLGKLRGWIKNSKVLLSIVSSKTLKFRVAFLLNRLHCYERYMSNNKQFSIGVLDWIKIFLYTVWQFIAIRHKSVEIKGI